MTEQFRVAKNCVGVTLPDGRKVNKDRRGVVTVPDRFAAAVRRSGHCEDGTVVKMPGASFNRAAGKPCPGCGADIFAWQPSCRSCGGKDDA